MSVAAEVMEAVVLMAVADLQVTAAQVLVEEQHMFILTLLY
jgi:hypothetical protein